MRRSDKRPHVEEEKKLFFSNWEATINSMCLSFYLIVSLFEYPLNHNWHASVSLLWKYSATVSHIDAQLFLFTL